MNHYSLLSLSPLLSQYQLAWHPEVPDSEGSACNAVNGRGTRGSGQHFQVEEGFGRQGTEERRGDGKENEGEVSARVLEHTL